MAGFFGRLLGAINPFREKGATELAEDISKKSETELIELGKLFSHAKELAFQLFKKPYSDTLELTKTVDKGNTKKFLLYFEKVSELSDQLHRTANSAKNNSTELKSELESLRTKIEESRLKTAPAYHNFSGAFDKWMGKRAELEALFDSIINIASNLIQLSVESAIAGKRFDYGKPNEKLERGLELERKSLYSLIKQLLMLYRLMPAVVLANKELKMALERIVNVGAGEQKEHVEYYITLMKKARLALLTACVYAAVTVIPSTLKAPIPSNIANLIAQQEVAAAEANTPKISMDEVVKADWSNYREIIENNQTAFVMYYSSKDDGYDKDQKLSWNTHARKFMDWVIKNYGDKINKFVIVELPYDRRSFITEEGWNILEKEVGKKRYPSFALYYNGKPITRMRGPPRDSHASDNYRIFREAFDKDLSNVGINKFK